MKGKIFFVVVILFIASVVFSQQQETHLAVNVPFRGTEIGMSRAFPKLAELGVKLYRHTTYADLLWQHVEPQDDEWTFLYADSAINNPFQIQTLATLYCYGAANDTIGFQVPWNACGDPTCGWQPSDSMLYIDYVETVVNRYKDVVKYWEIANEIDGHQAPPSGMPPSQFAEFMKMNYRWIKNVQPEAVILLASLSGTYGLPLGDNSWLKKILMHGAYDYFDVLGYHDYNSWWTLPAHVDSIRHAFQEFGYEPKPMWITECSISSDPTVGITPEYSSIDAQAADVWRRTSLLFAEGVEKFFWHPFWSGSYRPWKEFGLLDYQGKKKKSFYAFKLLLDEIDAFQTAEKISYGEVTNDNLNGGDGIWAVKFTFENETDKWVLWSPNNLNYTVELPGVNFAEITRVVPVYISADGETAVFEKDTIEVAGGELELALSDFPVLVKGINLNDVNGLPQLPDKFELYDNYPNPFGGKTSPVTSINYYVPRKTEVKIAVYDILGREIATLVNGMQEKGKHKTFFVPERLSAGVYFYSLRAKGVNITKKMLITK